MSRAYQYSSSKATTPASIPTGNQSARSYGHNSTHTPTPSTTHSPTPKAKRNHPKIKKEKFAFKSIDQLQGIQDYLLTKALNATRPTRKAIGLRNWFYIALSLCLARRGGDTCMLKWQDILEFYPDGTYEINNKESNQIIEQKTGKEAMLYFNQTAQAAIKFYLTTTGIKPIGDEYVFYSQKSQNPTTRNRWQLGIEPDAKGRMPINPDSLNPVIQEAAEAVGIDHPEKYGTHSLRKSFGYMLYKQTGDICLVQKILNHSSPAITLRYIGMDYEEQRDGFEVVGGFLPDRVLSSESAVHVQGFSPMTPQSKEYTHLRLVECQKGSTRTGVSDLNPQAKGRGQMQAALHPSDYFQFYGQKPSTVYSVLGG